MAGSISQDPAHQIATSFNLPSRFRHKAGDFLLLQAWAFRVVTAGEATDPVASDNPGGNHGRRSSNLIFSGNLNMLQPLIPSMRPIPPLIGATLLLLVSCAPSEDNGATKVEDLYLGLGDDPYRWDDAKKFLATQWSTAQVPMVLETQRFSRDRLLLQQTFDFLGSQTGQKFGYDRDAWNNWLWAQDYKAAPNYPYFKKRLYQRIDPKFGKYFENDRKATIRLDEVVWGGVLQDGIPPLRNPKMISAASADYLADSDVVFGIEVDGEARAYPKRILAWHEMFVDTIKGVPLAGVY